MVWKPGQSGNPSGKAKIPMAAGLARFIRENSNHGSDMAKLYVDVMNKRGAGANATLEQQMQAAEWLTSRLAGKAPSVELHGDLGEGENPLAELPAETLRYLIRAARGLPGNAEGALPATEPQDADVEAVEAPPRVAESSPLPPQPSEPAPLCKACGERPVRIIGNAIGARCLECVEAKRPAPDQIRPARTTPVQSGGENT